MPKNRQQKPAGGQVRLRQRFFVSGKSPMFLYSGEIHYFRIPQRSWEKHLAALVEAGCNAVSTYVPWSWHQPKPTLTDFSGRTHPRRNLIHFLDLAAEYNLSVTLKPGPYVMAELTDQGIPPWLTGSHPEILARGENGSPWGEAFVSLSHPVFRKAVASWLETFSRRIVLPRQTRRRGAVIMIQLCNEVGIFGWLRGGGDYSEASLDAWRDFLRHKFSSVDMLAELLDREIADFCEVAPPRGACATRRDFVLQRLWHEFHRAVYADHVVFVRNVLRRNGVTLPLFTNIGGWVEGRAHDFPTNVTLLRRVPPKAPAVFFGIDHIPESIGPANAHDGIAATRCVDELQCGRGPLYSAELQCGSREHPVQPYPREMALFYRQCLAHGLTALNLYMFSQGRNDRGRGTDGPLFYWYTALDYRGKPNEIMPELKLLGRWLHHNGGRLVRSMMKPSVAVAFQPYLYENEFILPRLRRETLLDAAALGIRDPRVLRDETLFDGVLRILTLQNISWELADITTRTSAQLSRIPVLIVTSHDIMPAETQQRLADYVRNGGTLVIFPGIPRYDLDFRPCRILADALGIQATPLLASSRVYMPGVQDAPVNSPVIGLKAPHSRQLARTASGDTVGLEIRRGRGRVRFFGFDFRYTSEEHPCLLAAMIGGIPPADPDLRVGGDIYAAARRLQDEYFVFTANFHRAPRTADSIVLRRRDGSTLDIGPLRLPPLTGLILPVDHRIGRGVRLLFAHAELLECKGNSRRKLQLTLQGPEEVPGRAVFSLRGKVASIRIDGRGLSPKQDGGHLEVYYSQTGQPQILEISFASTR